MTESKSEEGLSPQSKLYRERKARLQSEWRDRIFARDQYRCRSCGQTGTVDTLHLAHVTSSLAFVRYAGVLDAMDKSYRDDNLVTLCAACHKFQHRELVSEFDPEMKKLLDHKEEMKSIPAIQEWLELNRQIGLKMASVKDQGVEKKRSVDRLFRQLRSGRGWNGAAEVIRRDGGIPTWADLGFVPSPRCREPGGGPTARNRVAAGLCTWHARSCRGAITKCENCRLPYCEYHAPMHQV